LLLWGISIIIDTVDKKYYTYEYDKVIFETSTPNDDNLVWNVYGINLISREINGEMFYCLYNGHADITRMVDENGELVEKYYYDEWGVETETLKYGDLNADNNVDITDYTLIKQYVLKGLTNLSTQQIMVSDLNGDGKVDVDDTNILKQIIVKFLKCCPVDTNQDGFINEKNNIKYAGYFYDGETGLYYLNARFYDPETARFIQEDTYRGGINDPLSLNLYTYSHNNPISYYDPTGHSIKKLGDMFKFAATTAKVVAKAVVIPKAKKTAKTLKEDWQSGVDELKKGGVVSQRFAGFSKGVVGSAANKVNTIKYIVQNPSEAMGGMIYEWLDASRKNPVLMDPIDYVMYKTAKDAYTEGKSLVKNVKGKDWDAVSYKAGAGCLFIAEAGIASYASKAVLTKFKTPMGSKNALLDEPSINTSNFNFNKSVNPVKNKFFANQKATISRILSDETGSIGIGKNKNVGGGVKGISKAGAGDIPIKPNGGMNADDLLSTHAEKHLYNSNRISTPNKSQYGKDVDIGELIQDTMKNPDNAYSNLPSSYNRNPSRITKYAKEYQGNISTSDTRPNA